MNTLILTRTTAAVAGLATAGLLLVVPAPAAQASQYGTYYDTIGGVSARVAPPDQRTRRAYVGVLRSRDSSLEGGRQVSLSWKQQGKGPRTSDVRKLAPGDYTQFQTSEIACGKAVTVTLNVRYRASGDTPWDGWRHYGVDYVRDC